LDDLFGGIGGITNRDEQSDWCGLLLGFGSRGGFGAIEARVKIGSSGDPVALVKALMEPGFGHNGDS
jgi:hypothetical protein